MLTNEWYIVEETHEPTINRELWDRVQSLTQKAKPFTIGTIGLFAGKARCANCGYTMSSSKNHDRHYLKCSSRHISKDACIGSFISVDKLERLMIEELNHLTAEYLDKDESEQNIEFCDNLQEQKKRPLSDMAVYEKKDCSRGETKGEALFASLAQSLIDSGRIGDLKKALSDQGYRRQLYMEAGLS